MTVQSWLSRKDESKYDLPDGPPEHLVEQLVTVIEMFEDGYPTKQQLMAIKRLAKAIREEIHG